MLTEPVAGVRVAQLAHFGAPEQPYAREAHAWLTKRLLHRTVTVDLYSKDRYGRVVSNPHPSLPSHSSVSNSRSTPHPQVGMVHQRKWLGLRRDNISAEFLKVGRALLLSPPPPRLPTCLSPSDVAC